jgi:putative pyrroloquinoline-quinone binding quinoprotein
MMTTRYSKSGCVKLRRAMGLVAPVIVMSALLAGSLAQAEDWPARLHDIQRSGVTAERIYPPLTPAWACTTKRGPVPAWTESPAIHDYLHNWYDLKPRQNFDRCFDVAVVGGFVYFGSSKSGAVTCLNAADGQEVWTYFTNGPVRFAPHVVDGKVYVGSDDGFVYCLDATDGSLIWSDRAGPSEEMLWGNEHMISVWPVRTSVMVDGPDVFWAAGIFPEEGMYVCKRDAATGKGGWTEKAVAPPQGYLLALPDRIFVPTGKGFPQIYSRAAGAHAGDIKGDGRDGGCWALISPEKSEF